MYAPIRPRGYGPVHPGSVGGRTAARYVPAPTSPVPPRPRTQRLQGACPAGLGRTFDTPAPP